MSRRHETCDGCGMVTEPFWVLADRHYCRQCIMNVAGADLKPVTVPLVEEIRLGFLRGTVTSLWSGMVTTGMLAGLIVTIFVVLNVFVLLATNPAGGWIRFAQTIPLFAGFAVAFIGIVGLPVGLILGWTKRPRRISTDDDGFVIETAFSTSRLPFAECLWSTPKWACDTSGFYLLGQTVIVISTTDVQKPASFACGFKDESYVVWKTFLTLKGIPYKGPLPLRTWLMWLGGGAVGGGTLGFVAGVFISVLIGKPIWITIFGFLGFCDGCVWALLRALIDTSPPVSLRNGSLKQHLQYCRIVAPIIGFAAGMKIGLLDGLGGAFAAGAANAVVFTVIAWNWSSAARKRLDSDEATSNDREET